MRAALKSIGATQSVQYSWIGKTEDAYAFTAEIDHIDKKDNQYNHREGVFFKRVKPLSVNDGASPQTVRHSKELFNAVKHAYEDKLKCRLLLVKGTKYGTSEGGVKAAVDGDNWVVSEMLGSVKNGYEFILERHC